MELDSTIVGTGGHEWLVAQLADWPAGNTVSHVCILYMSCPTLDSDEKGGKCDKDQIITIQRNIYSVLIYPFHLKNNVWLLKDTSGMETKVGL